MIFYVANYQGSTNADDNTPAKTPQMKKLWSLAQNAIKEHKPVKAEKALLTILKFDEKNAAAYNRLGILYAKERHFKEAIECFEIAQSLDANASSIHNVGLIYLETGQYEKAAMAFRQAIELEGDQPARYIAYAKTLEKLGERQKAVESLETAFSLNPSTVVLRHLLELYEHFDDTEHIATTKARILRLQEQKTKNPLRRTKKIIKKPKIPKNKKSPKSPRPPQKSSLRRRKTL